jgi:hypothetical protein
MPYKYKDLNEFLRQYKISNYKYSCYDYISTRRDIDRHFLELKQRRISPHKYNDICVDGGKMEELLKLNSFTLLVNSFIDGSVYLAYLTIINEEGKIVLSPDVIVSKVKAPQTTDFDRSKYVDKIFYSIPLHKCKRIA